LLWIPATQAGNRHFMYSPLFYVNFGKQRCLLELHHLKCVVLLERSPRQNRIALLTSKFNLHCPLLCTNCYFPIFLILLNLKSSLISRTCSTQTGYSYPFLETAMYAVFRVHSIQGPILPVPWSKSLLRLRHFFIAFLLIESLLQNQASY